MDLRSVIFGFEQTFKKKPEAPCPFSSKNRGNITVFYNYSFRKKISNKNNK